MKTEEYLKKLTDQIRCAKARAAIAEEMRGHIDEQKHAYMSVGMEAEEAEVEPAATAEGLDMQSLKRFLQEMLKECRVKNNSFNPSRLKRAKLLILRPKQTV